jgi:3-phenylpropionate/trans-cinnamate dioxygenase ferredoxin reductase subunit
MSDPFIVIGADAAGLSAASKCRRDNPNREVIVFERGEWVSYAHCGTPYFIKGAVDKLTDLQSLTPSAVEKRGIELQRKHAATAIDTVSHTVTVAGPHETQDVDYDTLLIATGAEAIDAPIEGSNLGNVFSLHGLDDAANIRALLEPPTEFSSDRLGGGGYLDTDTVQTYGAREPPETVAIIGGGYVGIEMAEAFRAWDCRVHLFQRGETLLPAFGEAVGDIVAERLTDANVELHLDTEVTALTGTDGTVSAVTCDTGAQISIDAALICIGIKPNTELIADTPIESGRTGAIQTDKYGQTTVDDVYAAGDVAEVTHTVTTEPTWSPLGLPANRVGRAIGMTIAGSPTPVGSVVETAMLKAFDLECGRSGILDDERAEAAGFEPRSQTITAQSRSGYYPGAAETTVTLMADATTGRLLGGSIVGTDRAAVRINTIATALGGEFTVGELELQDLGYAPPFSPVWDPILTAAKVLHGRVG